MENSPDRKPEMEGLAEGPEANNILPGELPHPDAVLREIPGHLDEVASGYSGSGLQSQPASNPEVDGACEMAANYVNAITEELTA
ncbi:hypothetical protein U0070_018329 [Myodes glareolus]|uniref:Uncharacterized protein n=1 Tax=Myodes glareolus TaxID=447135 RepID=A0AAW0JV37_MYOGA